MILPYLARLVCLCLAAFFLLHAAVGLALCAMAPKAIRLASRMVPASGARVLLAVRLFPAGFALFMVAGLFTPSYFSLEPQGTPEAMGLPCLAAALMGLTICGLSLVRATRAVVRSLSHRRECRRQSREIHLPGQSGAAWVIDGTGPCVMLTGIFRPRLVISGSVVAALPVEQLAVVVRHERAHAISRDNLKRLLVLLAPGIVPFAPGFRKLEQAWSRASEWAADDHAAAGQSRRSLSLAEALVRVARLGSAVSAPTLATALLADEAGLSERVDRLLRPAHRTARPRHREPVLAASAALLLMGALIGVMAHPATLHSAHEFLELLIQ
jgi:beta-lactamase regulating signal transducer with metallopeptidase domain